MLAFATAVLQPGFSQPLVFQRSCTGLLVAYTVLLGNFSVVIPGC